MGGFRSSPVPFHISAYFFLLVAYGEPAFQSFADDGTARDVQLLSGLLDLPILFERNTYRYLDRFRCSDRSADRLAMA